MKINSLFKWVIMLGLYSTCISCTDHLDVPGPEHFRLKKTVYTSAPKPSTAVTITVTYTYDSRGNLQTEVLNYTTIDKTSPGNYTMTSAFSYDSRNRLVRIDKISVPASSSFRPVIARVEYGYDSSDHIVTETFLSGDNLVQPTNYVVSSQKQFSYTDSTFPTTVLGPSTKTTITYTNGNISQYVITPYDQSQPSNTIDLQYDNNPNPYYGVIRGSGIELTQASKNNTTNLLPTFTSSNLVLTYNKAGLLIKRDLVYPPDPFYNFNTQTTFEYETY